MIHYIAIAIVLIVGLVGAGLGVATNQNKRYPENARPDETLWVLLVIVGLPLACLMLI